MIVKARETRRVTAKRWPSGLRASRRSALGPDGGVVCFATPLGRRCRVGVVATDCHCAPLRTGRASFTHPAPHQRPHTNAELRFTTRRRGAASFIRSTYATYVSGEKLLRALRRFSHLYRSHIVDVRNARSIGQLSLTA